MTRSWEAQDGSPLPLGASVLPGPGGGHVNFALYSRYAEKVTILLFRASDPSRPARSIPLDHLRNRTQHTWHYRMPLRDLEGCDLYAFRVEGPVSGSPEGFHGFDPEKVLFDPYARGIYFPPGFDRRAAIAAGPTLGKAPLGFIDVGLPPAAADAKQASPRRPRHDSDLVIYEVHVRGFTRHPSSGVSTEHRGTYAGLLEKIPYLVDLGVTAVELMPVFQFDPQEKNFWGYMPISFFVPHGGYSSARTPGGTIDEFRRMARALHEADIEVILDVVYNHTGEGDLEGPVYNLKGIDPRTYYIGTGDPANPYLNFSGTGNTLDCSQAATRRLVLDSMRYWVKELGVDGFRFDLASALCRKANGAVDPEPPIFDQIAADPDLAGIRLIAEPWDALGLYQLGTAFPGREWMQWNDRFRDDIRRFVRGDPGMIGSLMSRLYGSSEQFPEASHVTYRPYQSVNYIASHDGFKLYDLVAYNSKHNEANGYHNTDGHNDNHSWNCGVEGDDDLDEGVLALRRQQAKNFCCLLFLANGTPMFGAGDEFLHTQRGNNNPFNQDNEITWLDWRRLDANREVFEFFRRMIAFRKAHPSIARSRFWRDDIRWYGVGRDPDLTYHSRSLAYCLHGASAGDRDIYVLINSHSEGLFFQVQEGSAEDWLSVVDTSQPGGRDIVDEDGAPRLHSLELPVAPRSVRVLVRRPG